MIIYKIKDSEISLEIYKREKSEIFYKIKDSEISLEIYKVVNAKNQRFFIKYVKIIKKYNF